MADVASLYPPSPAGIPGNLARPGWRYRLRVCGVILALVPFLLLYLALLACALGLVVWAVWSFAQTPADVPDGWPARVFLASVRISILILALMLFVFLFKGFFRRSPWDTSALLEVTEKEQPELFAFIHSLCKEIGCPTPARLYISHDVNAAVIYSTSIANLFVPPPKNLLLGLGLVNGLNLVEFKALLAHELGHYSQRAMRVDGYVTVAYQVIENMVNARDRWDRWVIRGLDLPLVSVLAVPLYGMAELTRWLLGNAFRVLSGAHLSLRRQMEFNADLVAVSVAGSDAIARLLFRGEFSQDCLQQSLSDLALAADQGLFTRNIFFHQERAADRLRVVFKNPNLGKLPEASADPAQAPDVFQRGEGSPLAMWAEHPSHYEREQNAKQRYFPSPQDDRPAWLLFRDREAACEHATLQVYQLWNLEIQALSAPEVVQAFLDEEYAEASFDPRYHGVYDNRCLELTEFESAVAETERKTPASPEELSAALRELYAGEAASWASQRRARLEEIQALRRFCFARDGAQHGQCEFRGRHYTFAQAQELLPEVERELEKDRPYLVRFDQTVFTLHYHVAGRLGRREEFEHRYRFHLSLQRLFGVAWHQEDRVEFALRFFRDSQDWRLERIAEVEQALVDAHEQITGVYAMAVDMAMPSLKHLKAGDVLVNLLPPLPTVPTLRSADSYMEIDFRHAMAFQRQLIVLVDRINWIQVKSLGGILRMQGESADEWAQRESAGSQPALNQEHRSDAGQ